MSFMNKIAVLGDRDSVLGFRALGLDVFFAEDGNEAGRLLHILAGKNYAIIYITETLAAKIRPDIDEYKNARTLAIIPIPGKNGSLHIGMRNLKESVIRAVGADIL